MRQTISWTFEELGKGQDKMLDVEFECTVRPGSFGSYFEPPEPDEVEFDDVTINEFGNSDGEVEFGEDWRSWLQDIAMDLAEQERASIEEALLERIGNVEEAERDAYYDHKRDEARGC